LPQDKLPTDFGRPCTSLLVHPTSSQMSQVCRGQGREMRRPRRCGDDALLRARDRAGALVQYKKNPLPTVTLGDGALPSNRGDWPRWAVALVDGDGVVAPRPERGPGSTGSRGVAALRLGRVWTWRLVAGVLPALPRRLCSPPQPTPSSCVHASPISSSPTSPYRPSLFLTPRAFEVQPR